MLISEFAPSKCDFVIVNKDGDYVDLGKPIDVTLDCDFLAFNRNMWRYDPRITQFLLLLLTAAVLLLTINH